jgi:glucose-1-phosphate adenylyltransferase
MKHSLGRPPFHPNQVLSVILGGGRGTRLFPLTKDRAKPAVPLGGKYRLVDIPISNCINSGFLRVFLLTQYASASLHRHISQSYKFDHFSAGFVEILAAEQTLSDHSWYQGTADAVWKNFAHFANSPFDYMLILSGDQLYQMDYRILLAEHIASGADVTVATIPVRRAEVPSFGVMKIDSEHRITNFVEKPKQREVQDEYRLDRSWYPQLGIEKDEELFLASMGIYVFNRKALFELIDQAGHDFGKEVIPKAIQTNRVHAFVFQGAWEDIGTIRAFFDVNLELTRHNSRFQLFDMRNPIFTRPRFLPATRIEGANIRDALIADGCAIHEATIRESVVGYRTFLANGVEVTRSVLLGNDFYEPMASVERHQAEGKPRIGIGKNTKIENAIVDKNARVGDNCVISPEGKPKDVDHPLYYIRDGVVIIPKNGLIPHGTKI